MRAIIVDDEIDAIQNLESVLTLYDLNVEVIARVRSAKEAIHCIDKNKPDLVFLDIEMPNGDGFSVLEQVQFSEFKAIFITAYSKYSIKALRMNALDYIMKPIDPDDLLNAIQKAEKEIREQKYGAYQHLIEGHKKQLFDRIGLPTGDGVRYLQLKNILRFQANANYTYVYLIDEEKPILVSRTLKSFDQLLSTPQPGQFHFLRVHQSHLVNLVHVKEYHKKHGSYLLLTNGEKISVSRVNRKLVADVFSSF